MTRPSAAPPGPTQSVSHTFMSALYYAVSNSHVEVARLLVGAGGQKLLFLTDETGASPLRWLVSRLLVERGCKRLLAAKTINSQTAEDVAMRFRHGALAGMLQRARVAKAGSDVWGQAGIVCRRRWRRWRW